MAAEHAAIGVQLVEDDVAQVFEDARPLRVVRQDAGVQHVRVREDDVAAFANGFARVAGRVAVVGEDAELIVEARGEVVELGELILRERLGGEEVEGARVGVFKNGVEDREVVAERFPGGGGSDDDEVFSGAGEVGRGGLVRIELVDPFGAVGRGKLRADPGWHCGGTVASRAGMCLIEVRTSSPR